jgi:hypothetical protein
MLFYKHGAAKSSSSLQCSTVTFTPTQGTHSQLAHAPATATIGFECLATGNQTCACSQRKPRHLATNVPATPHSSSTHPHRLLRSLLLLRRRRLRRSLLSSDSLSLLLLSLPLLLLLLPLLLELLPLSLLLLPLSLLLLPPRAALRAASSAALRSAMMRGICRTEGPQRHTQQVSLKRRRTIHFCPHSLLEMTLSKTKESGA